MGMVFKLAGTVIPANDYLLYSGLFLITFSFN